MIFAALLALGALWNGAQHPLLSSELRFDSPGDSTSASPPPPAQPPPSLDFDLLGDQGKEKVDPQALALEKEMKTRRYLLTAHQVSGFALSALMIGTIVTGQLNYADRFGGPNTGRYEDVHSVFAISTEVVFAVTGALALFAPVPIKEPAHASWSRADVHRFGMLGATVGMVAEAGLGVWTASREGYADQSKIGTVHLAVGYATLSMMIIAVGALVL